MLDFRISLEASNPARNCSRRYHIAAGTDLLGVWIVEVSFGRIGTKGRRRVMVLPGEPEARRLVERILRRRASSPRRIGTAYQIRQIIDPDQWAGSYQAIATSTREDKYLRM